VASGPGDEPVGDLYDEPSDYLGGWQSIQFEVTNPEPMGTLWVLYKGQAEPEQWTLLDRETVTFGFCKEI